MSEPNTPNIGAQADAAVDDPSASIFPESKVVGPSSIDRVRESDTLSVWKTRPGGSEINLPQTGASYRLIKRIGRGGMGEVWEAVQVSLNRAVAVKRVVTHGKASDSTAARTRDFMMEALVSARLEHPNIVPVHDLGRDEAGAPLLAMKLVKGASWETKIREEFETLTPEHFLTRHVPILIAVAQAVAFAHSRGVVHRDIKPSQVMLGDYGEVLLMDWGLAVVLGEQPGDLISEEVLLDDEALVEDSIYPTRELASSPAGTPAMMAPEQTESDSRSIGTWTDIYLLGSTLYYLITGTMPHVAPSTMAAMERAASGIVEPPSKRAPNRYIPRDLEDLCLKSMVANPLERTATAREFIALLQDHLAGASNRLQSAAITEVIAKELQSPSKDYDTYASSLTRLTNAVALWPRNPAVPKLREEVLDKFTEAALQGGDLVLARLEGERLAPGKRREQLLARVANAERNVRRRAAQRRLAIGASLVLLGFVAIGGGMFAARLASAKGRAERNERAAVLNASEARAARAESDELVQFMISDLRQKLVRVDPDLRVLNSVVARAADYYGTKTMVGSGFSDNDRTSTLESQLEVAEILRIQGDTARAQALFERARELAESQIARKLPLERDLIRAYVGLSDVCYTEGRPVEGASNLLKAREVLYVLRDSDALGGDISAELVLLHQKLGDMNHLGGDLPRAASEYTQALEIARRESAANPSDAVWRGRIASSLLGLGSAYEWRGELDKALELYKEATSILEAIHSSDAENVQSGSALCLAYSALGDRLKGNGRVPEARDIFTKQLELAQALSANDPSDVSLQELISLSHVQLGDTYRDEWRGPEAMAAFERALEVDERLAALLPDSPSRRALLARDMMRLGTAATISLGRPVAIEHLKDALVEYEALIESNPGNPSWRRSAATASIQICQFLVEEGMFEETISTAEGAEAQYEVLLGRDPSNAIWLVEWSDALKYKAIALLELGRFKEALKAADESVELREQLQRFQLSDDRWTRILVEAKSLRADIRAWFGDVEGAEADRIPQIELETRTLNAAIPAPMSTQRTILTLVTETLLLSARDKQLTGDSAGALTRIESAADLFAKHKIDEPMTDVRLQCLAGVHAYLARLLAERGDVPGALSYAESAIEAADAGTAQTDRYLLRPTLLGVRARLDAAVVFDLAGDSERARTQRSRALEIVRTAPGAGDGVSWRLVMTRTLLDNGQREEAAKAIEPLLALKTQHIEVLAMAKELGLSVQ